MRCHRLLGFAAILLGGTGAALAANGPHLQLVAVRASSVQLPTGISKLRNGAIAYRPTTIPAGPNALLILLHGAGEPPMMLVNAARGAADRKGIILLAPKSQGHTWDAIEVINRLGRVPSDAESAFGTDTAMIEAAIGDISNRAAIAPRQLFIGGHSDGASYALSLGLWNPRIFRGIIALSPGGLLAPDYRDRRQRIFIAHGRRDAVVPIEHDEQAIAGPLTAAGLDVRFHSFDGGHGVDPVSFDKAIDFVTRR